MNQHELNDITERVFARPIRVPRVLAWQVRAERFVRHLTVDDKVGLSCGLIGTVVLILMVAGKL